LGRGCMRASVDQFLFVASVSRGLEVGVVRLLKVRERLVKRCSQRLVFGGGEEKDCARIKLLGLSGGRYTSSEDKRERHVVQGAPKSRKIRDPGSSMIQRISRGSRSRQASRRKSGGAVGVDDLARGLSEDGPRSDVSAISDSAEFEAAIQRLQSSGVRGVAWDWDLTALTVHSGGRLRGSRAEQDAILRERMSLDFVRMVTSLHANDVTQAVLTHSDPMHAERTPPATDGTPALAAEPMVRRGLTIHTGNTLAQSMFVIARYPPLYQARAHWSAVPALTGPMPMGKQYHLEQFCAHSNLTPSQVLLVDDDHTNISAARALGYHTALVHGQGFRLSDLKDNDTRKI